MGKVRIVLLLSIIGFVSSQVIAKQRLKVKRRTKADTGLSVHIQLTERKIDTVKSKIPVRPPRNPDSLLYWSSTVNFSWDDFWGKPDAKSVYYAATWCEISFQQKPDSKTGLPVSIVCFMNKYKSWKNPKKPLNTQLLIHEKVHFNIAELYARKMRQAFTRIDFSGANGKNEAMGIYNQLIKELNTTQDQYDKETEHSKIEAKQMEWNMKISSSMSELTKFASE